MLVDDLRYAGLSHLRYKMQFPLVAMEVQWGPGIGYVMADIIALSKKGLLYEVEIKTSLGDLYADAGKEAKHSCLLNTFHAKTPRPASPEGDLPKAMTFKPRRVPGRFYYLVPHSIFDAARKHIHEAHPYAGLMVYSRSIQIMRQAPTLHDELLPIEDQWKLVRAQSATLVRLAAKLRNHR